MLKHRIKMALRQTVAGTGYALGAWRLMNRLLRQGRITILTLHCVGHPEGIDHLPSYMKLAEEEFDALLGRLCRSFEMISLKEAVHRLARGVQGRNAVVITLDDGYLDNRTHALPILKRHGVPATVFLEAGAVDRRGLSWIHKFFFADRVKGSEFFAAEYARRTADAGLAKRLTHAASFEEDVEYKVKRILKYEADRVERDRISHEIFQELGGDERRILDGAYLSWEDVKAMSGEGVDFGCHTMSHPILSSLTPEEMRLEILEARRMIESRSGRQVDAFAYPWGRAWDFNEETIRVLKEEGFTCGLAMDERSALPGRCDLFRLSRYPLAEGFDLAGILAEASGLFMFL